MTKLDSLFQPIEIAGMELKNRIVFLAAATEYSDSGFVDRREVAYMAARARGGAGLLTTGMLVPSYMGPIPLNVIYDDKFIPGLRQLTETVHSEGAKIAAQVGIQYFWASEENAPVEEVSPSGIATRRNSSPRALTADEIHRIVDAYAGSPPGATPAPAR